MVDERREDVFEVRLVEDQQPVETLRAHRPHEPLRHTVGVSSRLHRVRAVRHKPSGLPIPFIPCMGGRVS
jgi:hypothetical protein